MWKKLNKIVVALAFDSHAFAVCRGNGTSTLVVNNNTQDDWEESLARKPSRQERFQQYGDVCKDRTHIVFHYEQQHEAGYMDWTYPNFKQIPKADPNLDYNCITIIVDPDAGDVPVEFPMAGLVSNKYQRTSDQFINIIVHPGSILQFDGSVRSNNINIGTTSRLETKIKKTETVNKKT